MGAAILFGGDNDGRRAMKVPTLVRTIPLILVGVAGAGLAYAFDPVQGRSRRTKARDRSAATLRHGWRRSRKRMRWARSESGGMARRAWHGARPHRTPDLDDVTLAHRVESEVYRHEEIPKGALNIDAFEGTVVVRGAVRRPEQIRHLESRVRRVRGVRRVQNLVHLEGTPAPNKADALSANRDGS